MFFRKMSAVAAAVAVAATALVASGCSRGTENRVVIKGSTTVLPITQKAIEAYKKIKPGVVISVDGSGSGNGIKALLDGNCDIANSSREMKKEEIALAETKGKKIKEIAVGNDMLVPVVHPSNMVKNLTKDQLRGIYNGKIKNWKEVGGKDDRIVVISRDTSSGTYESWSELALHKDMVRSDALLQASSGAVVTSVSGNPKAIGYIGFGYVNKNVKVLDVNGVQATIENGKSGKFPISRKLYLYVDEKRFKDDAEKFVNFILSADGQKLVEEAGFLSR